MLTTTTLKKQISSRIVTLTLLMVLGLSYKTHAEEVSSTSKAAINYKSPPAFSPIGPGAVRPTGWLHDWARSAGDGITGNLDSSDKVFGNSWKKGGVAGWPLEQCAYWLDGLVRLAYILDDEKMIKKAKLRLDPVVDGVLNGGSSFIFWKPKSVLDDTFNNWAHSHMGRALVAYYQATGDKRILDALVKVYRDYPLPDLNSDAWLKDVSGACNVDPMLETYMMSGDKLVLKNALAYADRESFLKYVKEMALGKSTNGHGVVFYENVRIPALFYPWTGNKQMLEATVNTLNEKDKRNGLPVGLVSSEEFFAGIGSTRHVETCNVACSPWTRDWLLRITGAGHHSDRIEQVFFNAGPVPISRDFKLISYYQAPNRAGTALPGEAPKYGKYIYSNLGHGPKCCVGNSNRIIPNFVMHMWMTTGDGGLAATLYGPCRLETTVATVPVSINAETTYPFDQSIRMTVKPKKPVSFPLHLRIPAWCKAPIIKVNKHSASTKVNANGFVVINREWKNKDRVFLEFPMQATVVTGRENTFPKMSYRKGRYHARPLAQLTKIDNPYACVYYGPLLFSLPVADENPNKSVDDAVWNYALNVDPKKASSEIKVVRKNMPQKWSWQMDAPLKLTVPMTQFDWKPTGVQPLPKQPVESGKSATMTLVPYACTKYRISMFPVTRKTWGVESPASSEKYD